MNLSLPMTWKSTAVVSAAGLLATWLASGPPILQPPPPAYGSSPTAAKTEAAAAEIQEQASRLHVRIQEVVAYREPSRNPFRFSARLRARPAPVTTNATPPIESEPMAPGPVRPTLLISLSGIAQDTIDGQAVRTAIISMPDGVQLVKEGDLLAGQYKVATIGADAVELVRVSDGATVRLALRP
jgi:hypothetical protein